MRTGVEDHAPRTVRADQDRPRHRPVLIAAVPRVPAGCLGAQIAEGARHVLRNPEPSAPAFLPVFLSPVRRRREPPSQRMPGAGTA
ncbi:hypothetical protein AB0903_09260 [Streptomyces sp. NPDC048389]|uniref:hypothetical protein n=1 Tax=Streptomyces sp. NPDC048389 TaxID=3154622 RepID=UPI0034544DE7